MRSPSSRFWTSPSGVDSPLPPPPPTPSVSIMGGCTCFGKCTTSCVAFANLKQQIVQAADCFKRKQGSRSNRTPDPQQACQQQRQQQPVVVHAAPPDKVNAKGHKHENFVLQYNAAAAVVASSSTSTAGGVEQMVMVPHGPPPAPPVRRHRRHQLQPPLPSQPTISSSPFGQYSSQHMASSYM